MATELTVQTFHTKHLGLDVPMDDAHSVQVCKAFRDSADDLVSRYSRVSLRGLQKVMEALKQDFRDEHVA